MAEPIQSVVNVAQLMGVICGERFRTWSVQELAVELDLPGATVRNLLKSLSSSGWVAGLAEPGSKRITRWTAGAGIAALARRYERSLVDRMETIYREVRTLKGEPGELRGVTDEEAE